MLGQELEIFLLLASCLGLLGSYQYALLVARDVHAVTVVVNLLNGSSEGPSRLRV